MSDAPKLCEDCKEKPFHAVMDGRPLCVACLIVAIEKFLNEEKDNE